MNRVTGFSTPANTTLTKARPAATDSFYHLRHVQLCDHPCQGLACFAARNSSWPQPNATTERAKLFCLGQCFDAPAHANRLGWPAITVASRRTVLLTNVLRGGVVDYDQYTRLDGGQALHHALTMTAADLIEQITLSGLRGRGGAGFSAGQKWRAVAQQTAPQKYLIVNADEGDPGTFSDRILLEGDPFRLIEACVITARAVGATKGFIYLRKEYSKAAQILTAALTDARHQACLGERIHGSAFNFDLELVIGEGSYICGEESALLNALEGRRPEPRTRPPFIFEHGLFGAPTLVNNVETLCAVPWIIEHGAAQYAELGVGTSRGTKLVSLNSLFQRPGLYEVEFGVSLREIVEQLGGGLRHGELKGVMFGGPLAALIPPTLFDTAYTFEDMRAIGGAVGHGGVIAFDERTRIVDLIAEVFRFGACESCGKCTPCHLGSAEIARTFAASKGSAATTISDARWQDLITALAQTSLCGHGRGLAEFAQGIARHYPQELRACFR